MEIKKFVLATLLILSMGINSMERIFSKKLINKNSLRLVKAGSAAFVSLVGSHLLVAHFISKHNKNLAALPEEIRARHLKAMGENIELLARSLE